MNNPTPTITVLMPAFNTEAYIKPAIESILGQTFTDFEFLIIDDGSTDSTLDIIRSFKDERLRIISRPNRGLIDTLNEGIGLATAPIIARMDSDDISLPHRLEREYNFLNQAPEYAMVGSDVIYMDREGMHISYQKVPVGYSYEEMKREQFYNCPFFHPTVMFRKEAIVAAGGYPKKAVYFEDWLLWIRLMEQYPVINLQEALLKLRINPESVTIDEKWRGARFSALRQKSLRAGEVSDKDAVEMAQILKSQSGTAYKTAAYHAFIAKKYLWDNPHPRLAQQHLREVMRQQPGHKEPYLLYLASLLPSPVLQRIYRWVKGRKSYPVIKK